MRWWGIVPVAGFAAVAALAIFMFFSSFLNARSQHELDSAEDALYEGRYSDAVVEASNAIDMSAGYQIDAKAHLIRASAQYELGSLQEAEDDATTAIELAAGSRSSIVAVSYAVRAQTRVELGSLEEAIADATTAIGLARNDAYALAVAYLARGDATVRTGADADLARADLERGVRYASELPSLEPPSLRQRVDRANALLSRLDRSPMNIP
jgi:tetratricopeptide (TPR) repeat protein